MTLTLDQQLALAKKVYQYPGIKLTEHGVYLPSIYDVSYWFEPSLTGDYCQRAQALDVIVAAFNLPGIIDCSKHKENGYYFVYEDDERKCIDATPDGKDLLEAAALALLQGDGG